MIFDRKDNLGNLYFVEYIPFLAAPHPDTPTPEFNQSPVADAGEDQIVFNVATLNGGGSYDPDGSILHYAWNLQHTANASYDRTAIGATPTVLDLQPGFYDVVLTVTDNLGVTSTDRMLLAVAGQGTGWPNPNGVLSVTNFRIAKNIKEDVTTTSMSGDIILPELTLGNTVQSRITVELFNALVGGGDCVLSEELTLDVRERGRFLIIGK